MTVTLAPECGDKQIPRAHGLASIANAELQYQWDILFWKVIWKAIRQNSLPQPLASACICTHTCAHRLTCTVICMNMYVHSTHENTWICKMYAYEYLWAYTEKWIVCASLEKEIYNKKTISILSAKIFVYVYMVLCITLCVCVLMCGYVTVNAYGCVLTCTCMWRPGFKCGIGGIILNCSLL